ncbi:hypothetical protein FGB62_298g07 [Gracilaria domingensis]|nr:hypothetical protein FGB62_298g07 [Gracilaria domingensis]
MQDIIETSITTKKVIDEDDVQVEMSVLDFDDEDREEFFDGLDPDREDFEGYTGNAGPTLAYFYHCTFLFILPRSKAFALACEESFQDVVRLVLRPADSGAADTAETLLEAVEYAKDSLTEAYTSLANLLHVSCRIKHKDTARSLMALMDSGSNVARGGCISLKHVNAFVSILSLFGWEEFGPLILNLVRTTPSKMLAHAAMLAIRVSEWENMLVSADSIAAAVMDIWETGPIYEGAVANVAKMLFSLPSCVPYRSRYASKCIELSPAGLAACIVSILICFAKDEAKHGVPTEIAGLTRKYTSVGFTREAASQETSNAGSVFGALLCADQRDEKLIEELAKAIISTNCAQILRETLRAPQVREKVGDSHVVSVAAARARQLRYPEPVGTNVQPHAFVPQHPEVTAFLRSSAPSMKYKAFNDRRHASNFARKHLWGTFNNSERHCATASVLGSDYDAYVIITKVVYVHKEKLEQYKRDQQELLEIERLLGSSEVICVDESAKRRRLNAKEVVEID